MNRIDVTLENLQKNHRCMLSPYLTAGDPDAETTLRLMHAIVEAGADCLEIGIPFSDPMAEGPVIQAAMERSLAHNTNCNDVFSIVKRFRTSNKTTPIVLMGYVNPVECYGYEAFAKRAQACGVDGVILVDLPPEESEEIQHVWQQYNIHQIYLCSPTTSKARLSEINRFGKGYFYYVSLKGVTGSSALQLDLVCDDYKRKKALLDLPLMVGFGIKTPEMAANIAKFADGVIVGAALIEATQTALERHQDPTHAAHTLIKGMRMAIDSIGTNND